MARRSLLLLIAAVAALGGGLIWAFWPEPVPVDVVEVRRGPMEVTVAAEGITRVREPYLLTAPLSGTVQRSPVEVGDAVTRGETVVAVIEPAEPAFLDARARAQAEAALAEAIAAVHLAAANVSRAETDLAHAANQLERNRALAARGTIPQRALEDSEQLVETLRAALQAARAELAMREAVRNRAEAQLIAPGMGATDGDPAACCVELVAPQSGTVLAVEQTSARLVQAGEPLLTIGDLAELEVEVDLLSADAVRLAPGARATIERWGGEGALRARVRRIDPRGFTRVSALGIEEQRVRVHLELLDPPEARGRLGDAFRVFVRIVVWEAEDALQVPVSALFRTDEAWSVYRIEAGRAVARPVAIGQRTQTEAEVTGGALEDGDRLVAYPGDRVREGERVVARDAPGQGGAGAAPGEAALARTR